MNKPNGESTEDSSARLKREAQFHDHAFAGDVRQTTDKYYRACRKSFEKYRRLVLESAGGARVLEYGCGVGSLAPDIVRQGGHVSGIDISPGAIEIARTATAGMEERSDFQVMNAESLGFPGHSFDVVCGSGILHHLDLRKAY